MSGCDIPEGTYTTVSNDKNRDEIQSIKDHLIYFKDNYGLCYAGIKSIIFSHIQSPILSITNIPCEKMRLKQKTSTGITLMKEFKDASYLRAICDCSYEEHDHTLCLDVDDEFDTIVLTIYYKAHTPRLGDAFCKTNLEKVIQFYKNWKTKLGWVYNILFKGYIEVQNEFLFSSEDQINDYIKAISDSKNRIWSNQRTKLEEARKLKDLERRKSALETSGILEEDGNINIINRSEAGSIPVRLTPEEKEALNGN